MEIKLDAPIPAGLYPQLGINRLNPGTTLPASIAPAVGNVIDTRTDKAQLGAAAAVGIAINVVGGSEATGEDKTPVDTELSPDPEIVAVKAEFDRLSKNLKQPPI